MDVARFKKLPIMGILRGIDASAIEPLVEAVISSGLVTIEITMNTESAPSLIEKTVKLAGKRLMVGAGTVLNRDSLKLALDSGATFIVSPTLVQEVVSYCAKIKVPVFPGALTPQEIYNAWSSGATMVKVFPAKFFGPEYFREIKGPFEKIKLLACSGVTAANMKDYFSCGADAVSFGASVFKKEWLANKDFKAISAAIREYVRAYN